MPRSWDIFYILKHSSTPWVLAYKVENIFEFIFESYIICLWHQLT